MSFLVLDSPARGGILVIHYPRVKKKDGFLGYLLRARELKRAKTDG